VKFRRQAAKILARTGSFVVSNLTGGIASEIFYGMILISLRVERESFQQTFAGLSQSEIPLNRVGLRPKYAKQMLPDH
jgi:hypothetical protein